jgi:oligopeptide/dipeptide ABC transporter ATP-binding protein
MADASVKPQSLMHAGDPVLSVTDLVKYFPLTKGVIFKKEIGQVKAVDGVSLDLHRGRTLGVVGESGCGKSTLGRLLTRLDDPTSGSATFDGTDMFALSGKDMRALRRRIQIVFQDPYTSLDPRMTVADIVGEAYEIHPDVVPKGNRQRQVRELFEQVGLKPEHLTRLPSEFSGGQRQRIVIARALAAEPKFIVADEPVSALDVSVQAQVVNLLESLQDEFGLAYLFIAHDLSVVKHISDELAVMYLGKFVETGNADQIYADPQHPYTQALLSAVPMPDPSRRERSVRIILHGDPPSPANPPSGCRFHTRCWKAQDICSVEDPPLEDKGGGHRVACHFPEHLSAMTGTVEVAADATGALPILTQDPSEDFIQSDGPFGTNPTGYEDPTTYPAPGDGDSL